MIPAIVTVGPLAAANAALLAASQTPTSGTPLTLTGTQPDVARRILLTYGNEASNRTLVVKGTNHTGNPISETLAVPSGAGGTVATLQDFLTVTSALPLGGGWTAAVTLGTNTVASSPWKMLDPLVTPVNLGVGVVVSGTVNFTVEYTYDSPNGLTYNFNQPVQVIPTAWPIAALASKAVNTDGSLTTPAAAWRLTVNSGTGSATATGIQSGNAQGAPI